MGIIARIYDFVAGTKIKSADIDAELNQLVSAHNDHDTKIGGLQVGTGIADNSILNVKLATGIDAAKLIGVLPIDRIGDGTISAGKLDPDLMVSDITLNMHRINTVLDHPDGSVSYDKMENNLKTDLNGGLIYAYKNLGGF